MRTVCIMLLIVQYSSAQFGGGGFGGLGGGLGSCCCCCCPCPCPPLPPPVYYVNPCPPPTTGSPIGVPDVIVGPCGEYFQILRNDDDDLTEKIVLLSFESELSELFGGRQTDHQSTSLNHCKKDSKELKSLIITLKRPLTLRVIYSYAKK
ncbi:unnamed protein product [Cylicostephanus goldi]|uniref:CUB domain-containing protein n=1 Tax=Cylicostephanus goldi TaxID=71465 RepID=A0A3P6RE59_CYLGO|nr:unnamed protein product [Cylicostephanus goldi]